MTDTDNGNSTNHTRTTVYTIHSNNTIATLLISRILVVEKIPRLIALTIVIVLNANINNETNNNNATTHNSNNTLRAITKTSNAKNGSANGTKKTK